MFQKNVVGYPIILPQMKIVLLLLIFSFDLGTICNDIIFLAEDFFLNQNSIHSYLLKVISVIFIHSYCLNNNFVYLTFFSFFKIRVTFLSFPVFLMAYILL